jgi:D-glycero-alpha-D-manno-heptose-7-phosphate kinase
MILTRSPLRISLGGGGTDLQSYYGRFGGFFISAAIDKYVYLSLSRMFKPGLLIKYSKLEDVDAISQIRHPIVRTVLKHYLPDETSIEISSTADIPAGTGLGSSGSFTTALLKAVHAFKREIIPQNILAEEACNVEIHFLHEPIGKQDQYIASYGGITCFEIDTDGNVKVTPLHISENTRRDLEDNLLLFFTGYTRNASDVLKKQVESTVKNDNDMIENLHFIKQLGLESRICLENGDLDKFAELMNVHWEHKRKRSAGMTNDRIDSLHDLAIKNGAIGGKLIGAGGGGFLMFYATDKQKLRKAMAAENLREVRFRFDFSGTKEIV